MADPTNYLGWVLALGNSTHWQKSCFNLLVLLFFCTNIATALRKPSRPAQVHLHLPLHHQPTPNSPLDTSSPSASLTASPLPRAQPVPPYHHFTTVRSKSSHADPPNLHPLLSFAVCLFLFIVSRLSFAVAADLTASQGSAIMEWRSIFLRRLGSVRIL